MIKQIKSVMVVEDDAILLESYRYFINTFEGYSLIATFDNVRKALDNYDQLRPDIIISDISMPGINGITGLKLFKNLDANVKIVMVSVYDDTTHILGSFKNLADGYISKPISKLKLLEALNALALNTSPLSNDVARKIVQAAQLLDSNVFSHKENQIIELINAGVEFRKITNKLLILPEELLSYLRDIYDKLDMKLSDDFFNAKGKLIFDNQESEEI